MLIHLGCLLHHCCHPLLYPSQSERPLRPSCVDQSNSGSTSSWLERASYIEPIDKPRLVSSLVDQKLHSWLLCPKCQVRDDHVTSTRCCTGRVGREPTTILFPLLVSLIVVSELYATAYLLKLRLARCQLNTSAQYARSTIFSLRCVFSGAVSLLRPTRRECRNQWGLL